MPDFGDFHAVSDIISCRLVNWERNSELLDEMPHRRFLNLAVTYYIPTVVKEPNDGKIAVTDRLVSLWGVDEETLYRHALENTRRRLPIKLQTLEEVVREMMGKAAPKDFRETGTASHALRSISCAAWKGASPRRQSCSRMISCVSSPRNMVTSMSCHPVSQRCCWCPKNTGARTQDITTAW